MSGNDNNPQGSGRDKQGRWTKGTSGNNAGRRPKRRRLDVPNQLGRDILEFGRQVVSVPGPNGTRSATRDELVLEAVFASAMKGRIGAQKYWIELMVSGRKDLLERHPKFEIAEVMRQIYEDPTADHPPGIRQAVDEWIRRMKRT